MLATVAVAVIMNAPHSNRTCIRRVTTGRNGDVGRGAIFPVSTSAHWYAPTSNPFPVDALLMTLNPNADLLRFTKAIPVIPRTRNEIEKLGSCEPADWSQAGIFFLRGSGLLRDC